MVALFTSLSLLLSLLLLSAWLACPRQCIHRSLQWWLSNINICQSSTFYNKLIGSLRMVACVVWLSSLEAVQWRAHVTASTSLVKLEVETRALFSWMMVTPCLIWQWIKTCPDWSLVTEQSVYTVRSCITNWEAWSLFCLLTILNSAFQNFLAGVSHRESVWVPFPHLDLFELSAGILVVMIPLLDPSSTCPIQVCIPLLLFSQLQFVRIFDST